MRRKQSSGLNFPYRLGIGIVLVNGEGKIFIGQRVNAIPSFFSSSWGWQMPQGGIDPGETPEQAVLRELKEEIGTDRCRIKSSTPDWYVYDFPKKIRSHLWGGRYRGQKQKWFLLDFLGTDQEIILETAHPEFQDWKWVWPEEALRLVIAFKKEVYEQVYRVFFPQLFKGNVNILD